MSGASSASQPSCPNCGTTMRPFEQREPEFLAAGVQQVTFACPACERTAISVPVAPTITGKNKIA